MGKKKRNSSILSLELLYSINHKLQEINQLLNQSLITRDKTSQLYKKRNKNYYIDSPTFPLKLMSKCFSFPTYL